VQNLLKDEGAGFKIAMGAFDQTRPPVSNCSTVAVLRHTSCLKTSFVLVIMVLSWCLYALSWLCFKLPCLILVQFHDCKFISCSAGIISSSSTN